MKTHRIAAILVLAALFTGSMSNVAVAQDDALHIAMYRATLQQDAEHLAVREAYTFENPTGEALTPPGGALLFDLPHDIHGAIGVTILSEGTRSEGSLVQDSTDPSVHGLEIALPPGRTTITLSYDFHYAEETPFRPRMFYPMDQGQVFVQPADMHVHGGATRDDRSPMQGFASWSLEPLGEPGQLDLVLSGGGAGGSQAQQAPTFQRPRPQEEWRVSVRTNRFGEGQTSVLVGLFFFTLLGLGLLYGINSGRDATREKASRIRLTTELTRLEDRLVSGQIDRDEFVLQRERILRGKGKPAASSKSARKRQPVG